MDPDGYASNNDNTYVDRGFARTARVRRRNSRPAAVGVHERRRHPARGVPGPALGARPGDGQPGHLADDFEIYGQWGFRDSVNVDSGVVSNFYLSLDQGIIMAAIGNALADDVLRDAFATKAFARCSTR